MTNLTTTRRRILEIAGAGLALAALPAGLTALSAPALAQAAGVSKEALMKEGPLPDLWQGSKDAPVVIVEYASTTCSHCAAFHTTTFKELKEKYIDTGKVRFVLREFPLNPVDMGAYMLARCSDDKRDAVVSLLFSQQKVWANEKPLAGLNQLLRQTGMSQERFEACLKDQDLYNKIAEARDIAGKDFSVNSTPTFFVNGVRMVGAVTLAEMEKVILPALKT
ncbi:MAG: DsbA family protein [Beijerinckiaceae bacterium]|nr:DsbA family protein [Beijerinckiaceae bacterium]